MNKIKLLCLGLAVIFTVAIYAESKYNSGTSSAVVLFDIRPDRNPWRITAVEAGTDLTGAKVTIQGRKSTSPVYSINGAGATSQAVIPMRSTTGIVSNDVVYVKPAAANAAGFVDTVITVTSSNITMTSNLPTAVASGDQAVELETIAVIPVNTLSIAGVATSNTVNRSNVNITESLGDSPVRARVTGTGTSEVSVTAEKVSN